MRLVSVLVAVGVHGAESHHLSCLHRLDTLPGPCPAWLSATMTPFSSTNDTLPSPRPTRARTTLTPCFISAYPKGEQRFLFPAPSCPHRPGRGRRVFALHARHESSTGLPRRRAAYKEPDGSIYPAITDRTVPLPRWPWYDIFRRQMIESPTTGPVAPSPEDGKEGQPCVGCPARPGA